MKTPLIINCLDPEKSHLEIQINSAIELAKATNSPRILTLKFIKTESFKSRTTNTPLVIDIPILPEYEGMTQEQAERAILIYIKTRIKETYEKIKKDNTAVKSKVNEDTMDFFSRLDVCRQLDLDGEIAELSREYLSLTDNLIRQTNAHIKQCKANKQAIKYGPHTFETNEGGQPVIIENLQFNNETNATTYSLSQNIAYHISRATNIQQPIMLVIDFIRTSSKRTTAVNTPLQIVVPILPIDTSLSRELQLDMFNITQNIIEQYIRKQATKKQNELLRDANPQIERERSQIIEMLARIGIIDEFTPKAAKEFIKKSIAEVERQLSSAQKL